MERREILEILGRFGMNEYQAKVYSTMVTLGPTKAGNISKESKVPQSKIYEILDQLIEKQVVEFLGGRPKEFRAIPPQFALRTLIQDQEKNIGELKQLTVQLNGSLKPKTSYEEIQEGIWVSKGSGFIEFFDKMSQMLENCHKYAYAITRDFSYSSQFREVVKRCKRRGIDLRIVGMANVDDTNYYRIKWYDAHGIKVKIFPTQIHPRILVVDGKEVLIRLDHDPLKKRFTFHSLWSEDPGLARVIDEYMKNIWKLATPVDFSKIPKPKLENSLQKIS
jgi:sugar-specific transcriptional regulator TrmB